MCAFPLSISSPPPPDVTLPFPHPTSSSQKNLRTPPPRNTLPCWSRLTTRPRALSQRFFSSLPCSGTKTNPDVTLWHLCFLHFAFCIISPIFPAFLPLRRRSECCRVYCLEDNKKRGVSVMHARCAKCNKETPSIYFLFLFTCYCSFFCPFVVYFLIASSHVNCPFDRSRTRTAGDYTRRYLWTAVYGQHRLGRHRARHDRRSSPSQNTHTTTNTPPHTSPNNKRHAICQRGLVAFRHSRSPR